MKNSITISIRHLALLFLMALLPLSASATDWYASPTGLPTAAGTILDPFDLQTALNWTAILPGDNLWLRGGTYVGRFRCTLSGDPTTSNYITIASYPGEWAVLDGNITPSVAVAADTQVLDVESPSGYVTFKDFEVTYTDPIRNSTTSGFLSCSGIEHNIGEDCQFINLVIHDNPGEGFGSWRLGAATLVYGCLVYNNGTFNPGDRGHGPGFYVQNLHATKWRRLENNIVFNNFYKGFEVWSANTAAIDDRVHNILLKDNTVFNSGSAYQPNPGTKPGFSNIIACTDDGGGLGPINNIKILSNVLYHNTDYTTAGVLGLAVSLEVGAHNTASLFPGHDIEIEDNFISGRNNALYIYGMDSSFVFKRNKFLGRYLIMQHENLPRLSSWDFADNDYYSRSYSQFGRFEVGTGTNFDMPFSTWQTTLDATGVWNSMLLATSTPTVPIPQQLQVIQNQFKPNQFKVVLFNQPPNSPTDLISVDFAPYGITPNTPYSVIDVESYPYVTASGNLPSTSSVVDFDLGVSTPFNAPTGIDYPTTNSAKTPDNFGVFLIEFGSSCVSDLVLSTDVLSGSDQQQAEHTITAYNNVFNGATAIYHAGDEVLLTDHFFSEGGSVFHAYIEGCSGNYESRGIDAVDLQTKDSRKMAQAKKAGNVSGLVATPNPATDVLNVSIADQRIEKITITSVEGVVMLTQTYPQKIPQMQQLDISMLTRGIYVLTVYDNNRQAYTKKIIKM